MLKKYATAIDPARPIYDVLLDDFEKGMTSARLEEIFTEVLLQPVAKGKPKTALCAFTVPVLLSCYLPWSPLPSAIGYVLAKSEKGVTSQRLEEIFTKVLLLMEAKCCIVCIHYTCAAKVLSDMVIAAFNNRLCAGEFEEGMTSQQLEETFTEVLMQDGKRHQLRLYALTIPVLLNCYLPWLLLPQQ